MYVFIHAYPSLTVMGFGAAERTAVYPVKERTGSFNSGRGAAELAKEDPLVCVRHKETAFAMDFVVMVGICGRISVYIIILEHFLLLSGHYIAAFVNGGRYIYINLETKDLKTIDKTGAEKVK